MAQPYLLYVSFKEEEEATSNWKQCGSTSKRIRSEKRGKKHQLVCMQYDRISILILFFICDMYTFDLVNDFWAYHVKQLPSLLKCHTNIHSFLYYFFSLHIVFIHLVLVLSCFAHITSIERHTERQLSHGNGAVWVLKWRDSELDRDRKWISFERRRKNNQRHRVCSQFNVEEKKRNTLESNALYFTYW